jgi:hypothetical protein
MSGHFRNECLHGWVESSCRCMGPHKVRTVPCPQPEDRGYARHAQFVKKKIADNKVNETHTYTEEELAEILTALDPDSLTVGVVIKPVEKMVAVGLLNERLKEALGKALAAQEQARIVYAHPYSGHDALTAYHSASGYVSGIVRGMEILEALADE